MSRAETKTDIILIGAGIMSATLGILLKELEPELNITIFERLDSAAAESSDAWNNAGTGHSAFCELNYTPEKDDGTVDIRKAIEIAESFEVSKQLWAYLVKNKLIDNARFIQKIPHISFVWGDDNVSFLRKRYKALTKCALFEGMQYSEDKEDLRKWMPLIMKARDGEATLAATKMDLGTDVNFGTLTRDIFNHLKEMDGVSFHFHHEVRKLKQNDDGSWDIKVKNLESDEKWWVNGKFVYIGAGGAALPLLLKSDIPEGKGYGGFPVSGQWLRCKNEEVIKMHHAKVYGKAAVGSPPMSVPHLDSRMIKGKQELLFGPYAGFSTKFLKHGSFLDLPMSIKVSNILPMIAAGARNIPLTKYLIDQVKQSPEDRLEALKEFVPDAKLEDWELEVAGQRVQVIKKDKEEIGVLEFGTEVIHSADKTIAALLGASPGASTAASIMLDLLAKCFPDKIKSEQWQKKLTEMIPSFGRKLSEDPELCQSVRAYTSKTLDLDN